MWRFQNNVWRCFNIKWISMSIHYCGRNMDPCIYFTSKTKKQSKQWISPDESASKKAKTVKLAGKVMATIFWDARGIIHYQSSVETNDQWRRSLIGPFQQHFKEKTFGEEGSALPSRQCTGSHLPGTDGQIQRIPLRIASPSSIFARFSPLRLFPVSKPEEMIRRKKIHYQSSSSLKQRLILKGWTNHIIRIAWKSWRIIVGSSAVELKGDYVEK